MATNNDNQIYYLLRQVAGRVQKGDSLDVAVSTVKQITQPTPLQARMLDQLNATMPESRPTFGLSGMMQRVRDLLSIVKSNNGDIQKYFELFYNAFLQSPPKNLFRIYDISGMLAYLAAVLVVMTVIVTIYMIYVLPEFKTMFDNFGTPLPKLTQALLVVADNVGFYFLIGMLLIIFLLWYINHQTSHNLRTLSFCNTFIYRLPGISIIARNYNEFLVLNFLYILIQSGVRTENAITALEQLAGRPILDLNTQTTPKDLVTRQLKQSHKLGTLTSELAYQIDHATVSNSADFNRVKDTMTLFALITVAVVVGNIVIAMYLPIFQMGKIII